MFIREIAEAQVDIFNHHAKLVNRLQIAADFDGHWVDLDPTVHPGTWVGTRNQLGVLIDPSRWVIEAYVEQRQVDRIQVGASARFRPHRQWSSVDAQVIGIDPARSQKLAHALLDARHGGPIATQPGERQAVPVESLYRVRLSLAEPLPALREMRGSVSIQAQRQSPAAQFLKATAAVLVRESGF